MSRETGRRAVLLSAVVGLAFALVACGRATETDIFAAVGITPTSTQSPDEIATSTAAAIAQQTAVAGSPTVAVAALGDVSRGRGTFSTWCQNCHQPGGSGSGPDVLAAGGIGVDVNLESLTVLIREAEVDVHPPGPYDTFIISDRSIGDLAAYILAESSS